MNNGVGSQGNESDFFLDAIRRILLSIRMRPVLSVFLFLLSLSVSVVVGHLVGYQYQATVTVVVPPGLANQQSGAGGGSGGLSLLSAGGLGDDGSKPLAPFLRVLNSLTSRSVVEKAVQDPNVIAAALNLKPEDNLKEAVELVSARKGGALTAILFGPSALKYDLADKIASALSQKVKTEKMQRLSAYQVSLTAADPEVARKALTTLLQTADALVQVDTVSRLERELAYLNNKFDREPRQELRSGVAQIIMNNERLLTASQSGPPFYMLMLDQPFVKNVIKKKIIAAALVFLLCISMSLVFMVSRSRI